MRWTTKPPVGTPLNWAHPLSRGLIGCWPFAEGIGSKVLNVANGRDAGTLSSYGAGSSPTIWAGGRVGAALSFDGVDDFVSLDENAPLVMVGDGSITISVWARSNTAQNMVLVRRDNFGDLGAEVRRLITLDMRNSGTGSGGPVFALYDGTNIPTASIATQYTDGVWHHFVGMRDIPADKIRLYIDGHLIQEATDTTTASVNTARQPWTLGRVNPVASTQQAQLLGLMDDLHIYDRALVADEVGQLYVNPFCMFESASKLRWFVPAATGDVLFAQALL